METGGKMFLKSGGKGPIFKYSRAFCFVRPGLQRNFYQILAILGKGK
jgi:hypothetical protein